MACLSTKVCILQMELLIYSNGLHIVMLSCIGMLVVRDPVCQGVMLCLLRRPGQFRSDFGRLSA